MAEGSLSHKCQLEKSSADLAPRATRTRRRSRACLGDVQLRIAAHNHTDEVNFVYQSVGSCPRQLDQGREYRARTEAEANLRGDQSTRAQLHVLTSVMGRELVGRKGDRRSKGRQWPSLTACYSHLPCLRIVKASCLPVPFAFSDSKLTGSLE